MKRSGGIVCAVLLLGCQKPIQCDPQGFIIVPQDASAERKSELNARNVDFLNRRLETQLGRAPHYTSASLDKASGCP